jgi:hypothetical protein
MGLQPAKAHEKWALNVGQVANLRPIANRPSRVTTFGPVGWLIFRPCRLLRQTTNPDRLSYKTVW